MSHTDRGRMTDHSEVAPSGLAVHLLLGRGLLAINAAAFTDSSRVVGELDSERQRPPAHPPVYGWRVIREALTLDRHATRATEELLPYYLQASTPDSQNVLTSYL